MSTETRFYMGQKVKAWGVKGVVFGDDVMGVYPIKVEFENKCIVYFTRDGKFLNWHKKPSLFPIKFKSKKKQVKMYPALCKMDDRLFLTDGLFSCDETSKRLWKDQFVRLATELPPIMVDEV